MTLRKDDVLRTPSFLDDVKMDFRLEVLFVLKIVIWNICL